MLWQRSPQVGQFGHPITDLNRARGRATRPKRSKSIAARWGLLLQGLPGVARSGCVDEEDLPPTRASGIGSRIHDAGGAHPGSSGTPARSMPWFGNTIRSRLLRSGQRGSLSIGTPSGGGFSRTCLTGRRWRGSTGSREASQAGRISRRFRSPPAPLSRRTRGPCAVGAALPTDSCPLEVRRPSRSSFLCGTLRRRIPARIGGWLAAGTGSTSLEGVLAVGHRHLFGSGLAGHLLRAKRHLYDQLVGYRRFSAYDLQPAALSRAADRLLAFRPDEVIGYSVALTCSLSNADRRLNWRSAGEIVGRRLPKPFVSRQSRWSA